ncbi:MAG: KUP/HAK/KT family potassium transporter [Burkholderiaceae bacterium]|nr:KUP/HAK/KT family potassium transporter [Burkholderiaceae bacterium]
MPTSTGSNAGRDAQKEANCRAIAGTPHSDSRAVIALAVLGILSLMFWTLMLVISFKYMVFVLQTDNRGEGGTFALLALPQPERDQDRMWCRVLILAGILQAPQVLRAFNPVRASSFLLSTARPASWCCTRCFWSPPAARRCTLTCDTSCASRSGRCGLRLCCRR